MISTLNLASKFSQWQGVVLASMLSFFYGSVMAEEPITRAPSAYEWLTRMGQTFQADNYSLSLIRVYQLNFEPVAIEHGKVNGEELIYVNYLNGPEREVLHRGGMVTYFQHDESAYSVSGKRNVGPIPRAIISGIDAFQENYQFVLGGRNRVMGRAAQLVRIEPKFDDRNSVWLWLDAELGMLLRLDVISPNGEPLEHIQIVSMQYSDSPSPVIERLAPLELPAAVPLLEPESPPSQSQVKWLSRYVPPGFHLLGRDRHLLGANGLVDYQLYSDGMSTFSIYVGAAIDAASGQTLGNQGATQLVTLSKDGIEVAVIGSLPKSTLQRVAESVYPVLPSSERP